MLFIPINVAFSALNLCNNFVCIYFQRTICFDFSDLMTIYFMFNHHLNHFFGVINDLLKSHVDFYFF